MVVGAGLEHVLVGQCGDLRTMLRLIVKICALHPMLMQGASSTGELDRHVELS